MELPVDRSGKKCAGVWNGKQVVPVEQDEHSKAIITIETEHARIHAGDAYRLSLYADLPTGKTFFQMKTGDKPIHLKEKKLIDGTNKVVCRLHEAPTVADGTVAIPTYNANRLSDKTTSVQVF